MMALRKKAAEVNVERFAEKFEEMFGRKPTEKEFEEWCTAWGGVVERNKCVFPYVET
jgi:hypothetical protein